MALHLDPSEHQPAKHDEREGVGDIRQQWRITEGGMEVIAHGALVCPECGSPVVIGRPLPAWEALGCRYCGHHAKAREFLVSDVFDTVANEAYMVARLR